MTPRSPRGEGASGLPSRVFATANVVAVLLFVGLFGVLFFISLFLQNVRDCSPSRRAFISCRRR